MQECPTTILLIEDDSQDVDLIEEYLAKSKHFKMTLESADTLCSGLERLSEGGIDLVLCDLSLPVFLSLQGLYDSPQRCEEIFDTKSIRVFYFFRSLLSPRRDVPTERLYNRQFKGDYISGFDRIPSCIQRGNI